ncbi:MAG: hypothetical protein M1816_005893 [Peltula sp. TS41687]|nr:MAG: hypothetical protein M1816_005893 [Peltula sp. TS41687]
MQGPLDLSHHVSTSPKNRKQSVIKGFYKYFSTPDIVNLAGGLPNASFFPFETLEASVAMPQRFTPTPNYPPGLEDAQRPVVETPIGEQSSSQAHELSRVLVPRIADPTDIPRMIDLTSALQYGTAQGYPALASFLRSFTRENMHPNVPYAGGPEIILTCGNTDGFMKALQLLSNEWSESKDWIRDREGLLVEEFAYMNAIQAAAPRGLQIVPVGMDREGMRRDGPGGLLDVLKNWDENKGKRPHLMYTVPVGHNPTSGTLSVQRRRELYQLCQEYDIIIIEDDPYWYLQYPSAIASERARGKDVPDPGSVASEGWKSSGYEFLDSLVPSYLCFDTDGRVIRLDTFSKTIAPGCRLGWITAQPKFTEGIYHLTETSTQQPSGFVQSIVAKMMIGPQGLDDGGRGGDAQSGGWAADGWVRWLEGLRGVYERRMQTMCTILEEGKYLVQSSRGLAERGQDRFGSTESWDVVDKVKMFDFVWPTGGMFVWLEINLASHPLYGKIPSSKLSHALWIHLTTRPHLVLVAPGNIFSPTEEIAKNKGHRFYRLCFAAVEEEEVKVTTRKFCEGISRFWAKKESRDMVQTTAEDECRVM